MANTLGSSSTRMEAVIDISPSPESQPQTEYRPLPRKRPLFLPDGDDSAIELTDSTDSQSSLPYKRVKRRARSRPGPKAESNGSSSRVWSQTLRCRAFPQLFVDQVNLMVLQAPRNRPYSEAKSSRLYITSGTHIIQRFPRCPGATRTPRIYWRRTHANHAPGGPW